MLRNKLEAFGSSNQHVRLMTSNELDKCLREALYTDNVGCSDSILFDISQATYHEAFFERIMKGAWRCVSSRAGRVRRIQKGLNLLNYLAVNGSESCISDILQHMDILHSISKLKFSQANRDLGMLVVDKASQLCALVMDSRTLQDKRRYAASIRDRFVSVGSTKGFMETDVLHKPVFVLDKTKNNPQYDPGSFSGFGQGFPNARPGDPFSPSHISPTRGGKSGRRLLSRLFRSNLKISNKPQNIGLYGNNLTYGQGPMSYNNGYNSFSNASNVDNYGGNFEDTAFNAFPVINNTNDNYYRHNFSRRDSKPSDRFKEDTVSDDSSFKRYPSTSHYSESSYSSYSSSSSSSSKSSHSRGQGRKGRKADYSSDSEYSSSSSRSSSYYRPKGRDVKRGDYYSSSTSFTDVPPSRYSNHRHAPSADYRHHPRGYANARDSYMPSAHSVQRPTNPFSR